MAVDSAGNVYVADQANSTIRKMTPAGLVTTLAGSAGQSGSADGVGSAARFNLPGGVAVDSAGNVYVADIYNHRITKGTPEAAADTTPPVITCPAPVLVSNDGQCHAVAVPFENPTATDLTRLNAGRAVKEAKLRGHRCLGPEHVLLGVLHSRYGRVSRTLDVAGVSRVELFADVCSRLN